MVANLYTDTLLKKEREGDISEALFHFELDDWSYLECVKKAIRALLRREDLTASQISGISKMVLGLGRMPLRTPGLDLQIVLSRKFEEEASEYSIYLDENRFRTESGGYIVGPMGSDSYSGPTFEVSIDFRNEDGWIFNNPEWPDTFMEICENYDLSVIDLSDNSLLDWDHPDGSIFWEWIDSHPD